MEHSIDLAAKTFVQAVSPSSSPKILKMKKALRVAGNDNAGTFQVGLDDLDARLADFDFGDSDEGDEETGDGGLGEDDDEVDAADSVGKALLLVKQVCPVPSIPLCRPH
jgi:hypothetical protein